MQEIFSVTCNAVIDVFCLRNIAYAPEHFYFNSIYKKLTFKRVFSVYKISYMSNYMTSSNNI